MAADPGAEVLHLSCDFKWHKWLYRVTVTGDAVSFTPTILWVPLWPRPSTIVRREEVVGLEVLTSAKYEFLEPYVMFRTEDGSLLRPACRGDLLAVSAQKLGWPVYDLGRSPLLRKRPTGTN